MPDDRFIHRRFGQSEKVSGLSDLEFRVWVQYLVSADDFGIMRLSAVKVQADNDALARRPRKTVQRALERLTEVGLLLAFEHQGRRYCCQRDWQEFQRVRYPRMTHHPRPPPDLVETCAELTQRLFEQQPQFQQSDRKESSTYEKSCGNISVVTPEDSGTVAEKFLSRGRDRETANGKRLTATDELQQRFEQFWAKYPRKVGKDAALREFRKLAPGNDLLDAMLTALTSQQASPQWLRDGGQYIPHPRTWLSQGRWKDEPDLVGSRGVGLQRGRTCPHEPQCRSYTACRDRILADGNADAS